MTDEYHLQRFLEAQDHVYDAVLGELRAGEKSSHWMWFIFPKITGLGHSETAQEKEQGHSEFCEMKYARIHFPAPGGPAPPHPYAKLPYPSRSDGYASDFAVD